MLQGISADALHQMLGEGWKVEFEAVVAVFRTLNCHIMLSKEGDLLTRPHKMLTAELAQWKQEEHKSAALADLRAALRGKSEKSLATLRDQFPQLEIANAEGKLRRRVPSVRRLLDAVKRRAEPRAR